MLLTEKQGGTHRRLEILSDFDAGPQGMTWSGRAREGNKEA